MQILLSILLALSACGGTATEPEGARAHYTLHDLHPLGISHYGVPSRTATREYIHFHNEQGSHYLIYEELLSATPLAAVQHFRQVMGSWDMVCQLELDCRQPAFCTGGCRNHYYEVSNTPADPALADRNQCALSSYRCERPVVKP